MTHETLEEAFKGDFSQGKSIRTTSNNLLVCTGERNEGAIVFVGRKLPGSISRFFADPSARITFDRSSNTSYLAECRYDEETGDITAENSNAQLHGLYNTLLTTNGAPEVR